MPRIPRPGRSRQKSCTACAAGKRQCNRQTPQCGRCLARGIPCTYIHGSARPARPISPISSENTPSSLGFPIPEFSDELFPVSGPTEPWFPEYEAENDFYMWLSLSPSLLEFPRLSPIEKFSDVVKIDKWSTENTFAFIKGFSHMFAKHRQTPFIHSRLYESDLPDAISDAFTVSAAYCTKNTETEDMVFRILETKSSQLAYRDYQHESIANLLAATQALMIFQTIQLFDGNIRQRSIAERDIIHLKSMVEQLRVRSIELRSALTWQAWIFGESLRRTVLLAYMIEDIFHMLQKGYCSNVPTLSVLPITIGGNLWEAKSDVSWQNKVVNGDLNIVLYNDFSSAWKKGHFRDKLSSFEKFLLRPCLGEEYREVLDVQPCEIDDDSCT